MKKLLLLLIAVLIVTGMPAVPAYATTAVPNIVAEGAILIDAKTGDVLYEKNFDYQFEPASCTKMITCILALENLDLNQVVTIDALTPFTEGSRVYLEEGERITVEQLLYALMLESANDAAVALAIQMAGTVPDFAVMMNEKAKELGATNTNFVNPNGLHEEGHLTTAHDLAMIAKYGMQNEMFRKLVSTYKYTIPATNEQETRYLYNTNRLLYDGKTKVDANGVLRPAKYEGAIGIKTGYTSHAGGCLVSGAQKDGTELIAVVLKSTDTSRFGDSIALLDFGFANYYTYQAVRKGTELGTIKISRGKVKEIPAIAGGSMHVTLPIEASSSIITTNVKLDKKVAAPVKKGQQIGTVEVLQSGEVTGEVPIVASQDVESGSILALLGFDNTQSKKIYIGFAIVFVMIINIMLIYLGLKQRKIRRRKALRQKRAMEIVLERQRRQNEYEQRRWPY